MLNRSASVALHQPWLTWQLYCASELWDSLSTLENTRILKVGSNDSKMIRSLFETSGRCSWRCNSVVGSKTVKNTAPSHTYTAVQETVLTCLQVTRPEYWLPCIRLSERLEITSSIQMLVWNLSVLELCNIILVNRHCCQFVVRRLPGVFHGFAQAAALVFFLHGLLFSFVHC